MEVLFKSKISQSEYVSLQKKMDKDEKIVREALIKAWTRLLEQYARPGVPIPSVEDLRRELLYEGVEAAVRAVVDAHWFVFEWMVRDEIEEKVKEGLDRCDLTSFREDVLAAQRDPSLLPYLRERIKYYVSS